MKSANIQIGKTYQIDHQDGDYGSFVGRGTILKKDRDRYLVGTDEGIKRFPRPSIGKEVKAK